MPAKKRSRVTVWRRHNFRLQKLNMIWQIDVCGFCNEFDLKLTTAGLGCTFQSNSGLDGAYFAHDFLQLNASLLCGELNSYFSRTKRLEEKKAALNSSVHELKTDGFGEWIPINHIFFSLASFEHKTPHSYANLLNIFHGCSDYSCTLFCVECKKIAPNCYL